jgi:hypothetical protein
MKKENQKIQITKSVTLKVLNTQITSSHGYLLIHGYVVNKSDEEINHLVALASYFTSSNNLVKKVDMIIDDSHLKPKFMSVFDIATSDNPRIDHANLSFKLLFGPQIKAEGVAELKIARRPISSPFIDYEIRKNIIPKTKKN